ncbi:MAG: DEAD/DEAH box helicase, partial [bacterium]|nr:DEAD/DEAH box helicase [bacterium]
MYRSKQRNHSRGKNGSNFYAPRRVKLDSSLFIMKAKEPDAHVLALRNEVTNGGFTEYAIVDKLKRNIEEHGYSVPTAIQEKVIPQILLGKDVIGMANTGTGKTAAFLISLINKSYLDRNQRVLIVVPTRELAIQISDEFRIFARGTDLEAVATVGGVNIKRQTYALRHRPHFVIGTPGRLKDLIQRRELNLTLFQNIVLDEVDRMVDIGF